jgi:hypothetical protein
MGKVFVSHSAHDANGKEFLQALFGSVSHKAFFYSWEGPRAPHTDELKEKIAESDSVFVLLSPHIEQSHTAAWVTFEVGIAVGMAKPIWVIEHLMNPGREEHTDVPIPGVTGYIERPGSLPNLQTEPYYSLVASAGTRTPKGPDGRELRKISCLNDACRASYFVYFEPPAIYCPVCRKRNLLGK